jgi:signal transduction histidine kinase
MRSKWRETFFIEAASLLASSLDYEETLATVAQLAVRSLADFCAIDVLENGTVRRIKVAHADPSREHLAEERLSLPFGAPSDVYGPDLAASMGSGSAVLLPDVTEAVLQSVAFSAEHRRVFLALRLQSLMIVPLRARGGLHGFLLFGSSTRAYGPRDLAFAEKLARLAGIEVQNACLYREARQAVLARDRVLGIVAHDLRNPLSTIVMSADLLHDLQLPVSRQKQQLEAILAAAGRMDRLIGDLLDVARMEADRFSLERDEQMPVALAREAVDLGAARASAKSVQLVLASGDDPPLISADHDRLLQVLSNLIDNAIKFTPEGGRIEVRVAPAGACVQFTVADTGPGIAPDHIPFLFQSFWQGGRKTIEGAGLGLAIARGIVEAHGGRIWAESIPGAGSSFHFTIEPAPQPQPEERGIGASDRRPAHAGALES